MTAYEYEAKLAEYAKEVYGGRSGVLTLDLLIESHRNLRKLRIELESERKKILDQARIDGYRQGKESLNGDFIHIDDLKEMKLSEFIERIG